MIIEYYKDDNTLIKKISISEEEEKALKPGSKLLKESDKQKLRELLNKHNILVIDPRSLPYEIKKEIVKRANLELLKPKEIL